jgi:hypothetical protein
MKWAVIPKKDMLFGEVQLSIVKEILLVISQCACPLSIISKFSYINSYSEKAIFIIDFL